VIPQIMACRVPVITTTNAGGSDLIRDGENGFVVPIRDSRLIAQRIELLYDNPQKLEIMKMQAMETVLKGYTWADYGDRYCAFLKKLVG
jgi:glycosyltransferase involved in cell wall biosynthesis